MTNPFEDDLDRWVNAGLLDEESAASIRSHEQTRTDTGGRLSLAAEGLAYFGAALAASALLLGLSLVWSDWTALARIGLVAAGAIVLGLAGWRLSRETEPPLERLTDVLLGAAVVLAAWSAALLATEGLDASTATAGLAGGLVVTLLGWALWWVRRRTIPLVVACLGVALGSVALVELVADRDWLSGLVLWGLGAVILVAGWRRTIDPPRTAIVLGVLGTGLGAQVIAFDAEVAGALLGLSTMLALLALAIRNGSLLLLILGSLGVFVFAPQLVFTVLGDSAVGPMALLGLGVALIVVAIATVRTVDRSANA